MTLEELLQDTRYSFLKELVQSHRLIYLTISGSHAYGVATPASDLDIRGICLETDEELLGLSSFEQIEDRRTDTVIYGLKKFIRLCAKCNPNILEMLGTREEDIIYINNIGRKLRDNIDLFVSKEVYYPIRGFAKSEEERIELLTDTEKKKKAKYHYIRLLKLGTEILSTGKVNTYREDDIRILKKIRNGKMSCKEFTKLKEECKESFETAFKNSKLKEQDIDSVNKFLIQIYVDIIRKKVEEIIKS